MKNENYDDGSDSDEPEAMQIEKDATLIELEAYLGMKFPKNEFKDQLKVWKEDPTSFWCANKNSRFSLAFGVA